MTLREKLKKERPECCQDIFCGGCQGCPGDYGYPELNRCENGAGGWCEECFDQEIQDTEPKAPDMVNKPPHYTAGGIECIDAIAAALSSHKDPMGAWLTGQVIKYLWRWPLKNGVEDLKKARFYLDRLIRQEEEHGHT